MKEKLETLYNFNSKENQKETFISARRFIKLFKRSVKKWEKMQRSK